MPPPSGKDRVDGRVESLVNDKSVQTLLLDLVERTAVLETKIETSDDQRGELLDSTKELSERLGTIAGAVSTINRLDADVRKLNERLDRHDEIFAEARGGLKVAKVFWSTVWVVIGAAIGAFFTWLAKRF